MTEKQIWEKALTAIKREINSPVAYHMYVENAVPVSIYNGVFTLGVENELCGSMLKKRYKRLIEKCVSGASGEALTMECTVTEKTQPAEPEKPAPQPEAKPAAAVSNPSFINSLNPQYTFDNFVVGSEQDYAYALSQNVARNPGESNNPLYLYGRSGLGKTHLMQAIGNEILRRDPSKKVLYVTSERFTNELINAITDKDSEAFRQQYRDVDALLIDDVQFIAGKKKVQEEFFHTFNDLYDKNHQIVITSDRSPKEIDNIDLRIIGRFGWGVTTDMTMPNFETRVAILKKKAQNHKVYIDDEVLAFIAERISSSIRELEGALNNIISYAAISGERIDIPLAEHVLHDLFPENIKITSQKIIEKVSAYYKITEKDILGKSRNKNCAFPRQVAMYLCKTLTDMNYVLIGRDFGNKDRTTVMHNVDKIAEMLQTDNKLKSDIDIIKNDIQTV